jgi:Starch-binding associating with outer membrane
MAHIPPLGVRGLKKIMKKITIIYVIILLSSCKTDLTTLNIDAKQPSLVPASTLFSSAIKNLTDEITSPNQNLNIFRLLAQQWTETTYIDEANYVLTVRNIPQNFWHILYRDVLKNLRESKKLNTEDATLNPDVKANLLAIEDIMEVYTYSLLVNTFGDIPYSESLDFNNLSPKYDNAKTIYTDLLKRLDIAITALKVDVGSYSDADLIYGGDVVKWKSFANTLKFKMGMMLVDSDPNTAKSIVESTASKVFQSSDENATLHYLASPPNTNPVWTELIQSARKDFVAANTIIDKMTELADPRIGAYFTKDANDGYSGGKYAYSSSYTNFSKPSQIVTDPTNAVELLDYTEIEFLLAEAAARGMNVGGTAQEHYNKAIQASFEYWGVNGVSEYLATESVNYSTAHGDYKEKIGTQKWIALYNRGYEAWTEWRRLDYPILNLPAGKTYADIPVRYTYPVDEQNLNTKSYTAAAAAVGGDKVGTKLFWDKF